MSSDDYFENDDLDLDPAAYEELDAIEAALLSPKARTPLRVQPNKPVARPLAKEDSFCDLTFDIDETDLQRIDNFIEDTYQGKAIPVPGPSKLPKTTSKGTVQTTLFGDVISSQESSNKPRSQTQRTKSTPRNPFGQQAPKTKKWDQTAFAKTGLKRAKSKGKTKAQNPYDGDENEEEDVEFEQFPAPFVSLGPPPPMKLSPDLLEAKHWIYPLNKPKRDYQFNIVKHCLFDNTLVALPTGLGKTFIAGVVMLNFYRWFPDGKVVFVAPTKPLVAQQVEACHQTCGIPGSDAIELTGENPKPMRARAWKEKRIFYMTPQTLVNDLTSENCEVRDIVLLVIDEAHKGTGNYAYAQIIRFLMAKNPHFRVLALTATPGSNPDAVQELIDALHISRIEIRDENSLDLKAYIHHKKVEQHIIKMSEDVTKIMDLLAKLMDSIIKPLQQRGVLYAANAYTMHPFYPQRLTQGLKDGQKWAFGPLMKLSSLARAMGYLVEGTLGMCYSQLQAISQENDNDGDDPGKRAAATKAKKLRSDPLFQALMKEAEVQRNRGFAMHPKMERLKGLVVQHFGEKIGEKIGEGDETRVMVFVTFRECVDEVVEALNFEKPLIRAIAFIGQGTDKHGKKGLAQKEQLEIIKKFKAGEYNVLVATSIGEEGLDIGEVDLIVCYDAQKTPIRMLQRVGRTGRKRAGVVHVLLAEGREEQNFDKAKDAYSEVQKTIWRGAQLELYADVERLLPEHIKPECLEKEMEILEYVRDDGKKKGLSANEGPLPKIMKRKRNDNVGRNIPDGAMTGFVSAGKLVVAKSKKQKKAASKENFDLAGQDDDTDIDIESGIVAVPPRRTMSSSATRTSGPSKPRKKLRKAATIDPKGRLAKKNAKKIQPEPSSQFSQKGVDDSDDMDIEHGRVLSSGPEPSKYRSPSLEVAIAQSIIELSDSDSGHPSSHDRPEKRPSEPPSKPFEDEGQSMAWLVDDDDEPDIVIVGSSPISERQHSPVQSPTDDESIEFIGDPPIISSFLPTEFKCHGFTYRSATPIKHRRLLSEPDESVEFVENSDLLSIKHMSPTSTPERHLSSSLSPVIKPNSLKSDMPPPILPARFLMQSPASDPRDPEPSFPVRPLGKNPKRRRLKLTEQESPLFDIPPSQRRLHHQRESSPARHPSRKQKRRGSPLPQKLNPLLDVAAIHSGDDVSEGSSQSEVESESDRLFLQELPETQTSASYDQTMAYRQSLFSQVPGEGIAPVFAKPPVRKGAFGGGSTSNSRRRPLVSSSPPQEDDEPDEYAIGSFVVDDDAEISYLANSSHEL